jgi:hypothetical protein
MEMKNAIVGLGAVVLMAAAGWWLTFGALSPCDAMRAEARRVADAEAGLIGRAIGSALVEVRTNDFTPLQCASTAVKLRLQGKEALKVILLDSRTP